ncbi:MAG: hypothetical protein IT497_09850 [Ottowia sp.]|nr:hypothetical protein [Ottowia sp.]
MRSFEIYRKRLGMNNYLNCFGRWLVGKNLASLLIGLAALFALYKTDSMLDRVIAIQNKMDDAARDVNDAAKGLNESIIRLDAKVDGLKSDFATFLASQLTNPKLSKSEIEKVIGNTSLPGVYLPREKIDTLITDIQKSKPEDRKNIIERALKSSEF